MLPIKSPDRNLSCESCCLASIYNPSNQYAVFSFTLIPRPSHVLMCGSVVVLYLKRSQILKNLTGPIHRIIALLCSLVHARQQPNHNQPTVKSTDECRPHQDRSMTNKTRSGRRRIKGTGFEDRTKTQRYYVHAYFAPQTLRRG